VSDAVAIRWRFEADSPGDAAGGDQIGWKPMALYVVRHGKAGQRASWDGPDLLRPLTRGGRAQAQALAAWLANEPIERVLSSPYTRCVQTVQPLAEKLGLHIEETEQLSDGMPFEPVLELLQTLPEPSVLCSHGDLIPDTIEALMRRGTVLDGQPDWRKGATWVLTREGSEITKAYAVAPGA
jgi:8-oxo-dGTP diphosphatase